MGPHKTTTENLCSKVCEQVNALRATTADKGHYDCLDEAHDAILASYRLPAAERRQAQLRAAAWTLLAMECDS